MAPRRLVQDREELRRRRIALLRRESEQGLLLRRGYWAAFSNNPDKPRRLPVFSVRPGFVRGREDRREGQAAIRARRGISIRRWRNASDCSKAAQDEELCRDLSDPGEGR